MQAYRIITLEKTRDIPALDSLNGKWYRYIISNGVNDITGYRCGNLSEVREYITHNIHRLNQKYDLKNVKESFNKPFIKPCNLSGNPLHS